MSTIKLAGFVILFFLGLIVEVRAQTPYQMQAIPVQSRWAREVSASNALPEYPRPQMVRTKWINLNGLWSYAITEKDAGAPVHFDGQILVPFPLESALSGVKKSLLPSQRLWYKRVFERPAGERVLLHFGAVDWQAVVWVNGREVGGHSGGYTAFSIDITDALKDGENVLLVGVYDPTDEGVGPHGKQVLHPQGIYYTPSSGIWQTVWLEPVPSSYVKGLLLTPDIDKGCLHVVVEGPAGAAAELVARDGGVIIGRAKGKVGASIVLPVPHARLWSPAHPFLYDLEVRLVKGGKRDMVQSYFGMRKIAIGKDERGADRIFLNNQPYFNLGTLDQGFWPDGLYTAPTDEALAFDIRVIKAMGFNTIRKHIKVEPARWYYHADKIGVLVWQDMVNPNQGLPEGAKAAFERESAGIITQLHNVPSIVVWVLFNEKWGQYDQERLTKWLKAADPSRIVNGHTGEILYVNEQLRSPSPNAYVGADMTDVHAYPDPMISIREEGKARVVGEFGGIGVFIPDHQWNSGSAWGYVQERPGSLQAKYTIMQQHLQLLENEGLGGSIYTQPFDVEGEQNGLLTYDRAVIKIPLDSLRKIHRALNPDMGEAPAVVVADADLTEVGLVYSRLLQRYIDGERAGDFLLKLAMAAVQAGDKPGAAMAEEAWVRMRPRPLPEEDVQRLGRENLMSLVFRLEIEPGLNAGVGPDWVVMEAKCKQYGDAGLEIFLRAKTIYFLNHRDWGNYGVVARVYLERYGDHIPDSERTMFRDAMDKK